MASHRAVATILLLAMAVIGTAQAAQPAAAAKDEGAVGTSGANNDGRSHGAAASTPTSARVPLPLAAVTVRCTKFHVLKEGETCASVARDFRLTLTQFMVLNREYNYTWGAAPLPRGRWVCVRGIFVG